MIHSHAIDYAGIARDGDGENQSSSHQSTNLRIAQLLCSRLCHDLVGPSGAIHNGIEFMSEDGGADAAALSLVAASATELNNRLAFYRLAFGLAGGAHQTMTLQEAADCARGVMASLRVTLDWRVDMGAEGDRIEYLPVDDIRLILGQVLIGKDALPRGGTVSVRCVRTGAGIKVSVVTQGPRAGLPSELLAAMNPDAPLDSLTSRTVHAYFLAALARQRGADMSVEQTTADEVALTVSLRPSRNADPVPFPARASAL